MARLAGADAQTARGAAWFTGGPGTVRRIMSWRRAPARTLPDDAAIASVVGRNVRLARDLNPAMQATLLAHTTELLQTKRWEAAADGALTDEAMITIAANAAIPILSFDTWPYRQVKAIIVRPTAAYGNVLRSGPVAGTYTDTPMGTIGEATPDRGPIAISWDAALHDSRYPALGSNVVIHEFAHKIDMADGYADGVPPLRGVALDEWRTLLDDEYHRSEPQPSDEVLRPYAWASPAEYFAVATEVFFCRPAELEAAKPRLYAALCNLYQQDPAHDRVPPLP